MQYTNQLCPSLITGFIDDSVLYTYDSAQGAGLNGVAFQKEPTVERVEKDRR
jgi:hypothetical protein